MKTLLSCERVFELLTRGPFPSGEASDVQVAEHLEVCHECRELAEALRPAVDVLHESLLAADRVGLPCYDPSRFSEAGNASVGFASPELAISELHSQSAMAGIMARVRESSVALANGAIEDARPQKPARMANFFSVVSIAAALAAVLLVAAFVPRHGASGASAAMPKTDSEKRDYLLQMGVLESCLQTTTLAGLADLAEEGSVSPHEGATDCCTDCHFAADAQSPASPTSSEHVRAGSVAVTNSPMPKKYLAVLASSCLACHEATPQ